MANYKNYLLQRIANRKYHTNSGFTLVELIVVVVIIGVLSAIAVPSFTASADKAKQKEVSTLLGSYIKGVQAYYTEYSELPTQRNQLGQFVALTACPQNTQTLCKTANPVNLSAQNQALGRWNSPSGLYDIAFTIQGTTMTITALPQGQAFATAGFATQACFNTATAISKVDDKTTKGRTITTPINCG